jgi:hypothetical protein
MLEFLRGKVSDRKLRLFAVACCQALSHPFQHERYRRAADVAERCAEGIVSIADLGSTRREWERLGELRWHPGRAQCEIAAIRGALHAEARIGALQAAQALRQTGRGTDRLLNCVTGNPFRPPSPLPAGVLAWNDATVRRLAEAVYGECAWGKLPVLADALLDAGCQDEELMRHCRLEEPHVRGCWAVDLILGRS